MPRDAADPFAQLLSCHRRLEERLDDLADPADPRAAARDVLGFFDRNIMRHEEDEEASLFPRLAREPSLAPTLATLRAQHVAQRESLGALRAFAEGADAPPLADIVRTLREAYAAHIDLEERELFPAARRVLRPEEAMAIGEEMAARRPGGGGGGGGGGRRR
jgi:hemerythrin-like domain-containing protein